MTDHEAPPTKGVHSRVALEENDAQSGSSGNMAMDQFITEEDMMEDEVVSLVGGGERTEGSSTTSTRAIVERALHKTLFSDMPSPFRDIQIMEGQFSVKLLKFLVFTFASISFLHWIVSHRQNHRDRKLTLGEILMYEGNLIASDAVIFFLMGRLWKQRGVDHLAWVGVVVLSNLYFESQHYTSFMQHSFTLYEMHCVWPWQLWIFAGLAVPVFLGLAVLHVIRAYNSSYLGMKVFELAVCSLFYLVPLLPSSYFHLHHWFAGWFFGMHCNFDVWWSRAVMAWCWGMYINGIAVYGKDPVLTCEYAYFLTTDLRCPYVDCYLEYLEEKKLHNITHHVKEMIHPNWKNCSADSYHP